MASVEPWYITRVMARALSAFTLVASLVATGPARANPAAAEALFREARKLLDQGQVDAACEKFDASNALESSSGTLLNLAACRQQQGRTATAWAHFVSAERAARNQNRPEHAQEAQRRAQELEPKLSYLTIQIDERPEGLEVRRDGQVIAPGSFGTKVPVDPGPIVIEASAPGYESIRRELTIGDAADSQVLQLPALPPKSAPGKNAASIGVESGAPEAPSHGPGAAPFIIGGIGVAALGVGSVFGVMALSSNSEAKDKCSSRVNCDSDAIAAEDRRDTQALIATVGIGVGLVGVGVATWMLLSSGKKSATDAAWLGDAVVTKRAAVVRVTARF